MYDNVKLNRFGYYELKNKPTKAELEAYYSKLYYQDSKGAYEHTYTAEELKYFYTQVERKFFLINKLLGGSNRSDYKMLDIGCGEGWALKYFREKGWNVLGLDYSDFGCRLHNPDCLADLVTGDIYENIQKFHSQRFHCVWLDNVLEHVPDPLELLNHCKELLEDNGVLLVEVPNDFSIIQQKLFEQEAINRPFWVVVPDHISYFNRDGLMSLCKEAGFAAKSFISDYPIDFNLFNENTNYINDPSKGKACHRERVTIENLMNEISVEKTIQYYTALSELGLGRSLIGFFQKDI